MQKLFEQVWEHKAAFLGTFFVVFTLSYLVLLAIDFVPEEPVATDPTATTTTEITDTTADAESASTTTVPAGTAITEELSQDDTVATATAPAVLPQQIVIAKLNKTVPVHNPVSRTIADLDAALLEGAVRHPDSATLNQDGNVFILGHSSYLPNVLNRNFQAFNGIQDLAWGDTIEVYAADTVYEYRVETVYRARAQDVTVPVAGTGKMLTLATCNSFGSVDDRYIVEAKQVRATPR